MDAYPTTTAFKLIFGAYKTLKTFNKKLPSIYFRELIAPYADMILQGNDSFVKGVQVPPDTSFILKALVPDIIAMWETAPADIRKAVEDYMKALVVLSRQNIE